MFKNIVKNEVSFPNKPIISDEGKDFIRKVIF